MQPQIFKANLLVSVVIPIIIAVVIVALYFTNESMPAWTLLLLIVPVIFSAAQLKTKLVIEKDLLRYEKLFGGNEVSLNNVSEIVTREVETIVERNQQHDNHHVRPSGLSFSSNQMNPVNQERKVERLVYVLDASGRTHFSFPAGLIGFKNRQNFIDAVNAANPNITVS
ncbi:hypothetical protein [Sporosarcina sp. 6E9]|uniref:hypothetical protein n=1 Tax=Sporosarcina sp. 6E9 TaxID=2819235 RepID=UPI001AD4B4AC|nr:hypothetical protein [Sporosarcina sp. 6E9]MBO1910254.1 hypothetical protein [Microvirga sp. 3-52]